MDNGLFIEKAKLLILDKINNDLDYCKKFGSVSKHDIYVVWLCKILANNKALLSAANDDGLYFEVTYDGAKGLFYIDSYVKQSNAAVSFSDV